MDAKKEKLLLLSRKRQEAIIQNRKDMSNSLVSVQKQDFKKKEALELLEKKQSKELQLDYERIKNSKYSIQQVEDWNSKVKDSASKDDGFTDFIQVQAKSYQKKINKLNINQKLQEYQNMENNGSVSQEALEKLSKEFQEVKKKKRETSADEDVTYINNRNQHFNKKLKRSYDKFTREIRDNLERGTAL